MGNKLYTFIHYPYKWLLVKMKIIKFFQYYYNNILYKKFGRGSSIIKPMRIIGKKFITVGDNVDILNNARIEVIREWNKVEYESYIHIGDNVSIGQNFHLISASYLDIGNNVTISGNVFITNVNHKYQEKDMNILQQDLVVKETKIGDNCFIGFGASIQAGTTLGKHCIVGTNAVVSGIFEDYSVIVGVPGKTIKKYNQKTNQWENYYG